MALTVKFWTFGKRDNATSTPPGNPAANFTAVQLKDDCSVVNPALLINAPVSTRVYDWNYCQIVEFDRYYYVSDWMWNNGVWNCELQVDVLASFRYQIGQQSVYVLRAYQDAAGNTLFDGNIIDTTYPCTTAAPTYTAYAVDNPYAISGSGGSSLGGSFIVGIVNRYSDNGAVSYYAMTAAQFAEFCGKLYNYSSGWLDIDVTEISENLQKALVNPFQYIVSCVYLPIPVSSLPGATSRVTIYFGWWFVNLSSAAKVVYSFYHVSNTVSLSIPRHPSSGSRGAYLNVAPYSFYTLRAYPFGTVDIDSEAIANYNTLDLYFDVDVVTGAGELNICVNGKSNPIRTLSSQVGVSVPTASIMVDYTNLGKGNIVAGASAAVAEIGSGSGGFFQNLREKADKFVSNIRAGNWQQIGQNAKESITKIASSALAAKATVEISGQQGTGSLYYSQPLTLSGRFLPVAPEDHEHRGRPLCQVKTINTLKGFILCADADISIPCTEREKNAIQAYMEAGFYYY